MADIIIDVLGKMVECAVAPIGKQFGYVFCFNANIETLKDEAKKLDNVKDGVKIEVDGALRNVEIIYPVVESWLCEVDTIGDQAQSIIEAKDKFHRGCFNHWCLNLKGRYVLSRNAKKKTENIIKLRVDGRFDKISYPEPLVAVVASSSTTMNFNTRKSICNEILRKLKDDNINMIGICGMGGVGKTTMADEVLKRVKEEKLFNDWAMTVISQKQDLAKAQSDIAEMLGSELREQNPRRREAKLHRRLQTSKVLVLLDDVWKEFDLKVLGISFEKGCKVLFTSREQGLWRGLKTKIDFPLDVLTEKEAWELFEEKVGDYLQDKPELRLVAKDIVKECGGLPLALVAIGGALLGKSTHLWKDTLRQLRTDYPTKIPGVFAKVYQSLELSYNYLEDEDAKSLFLLCCLFEEDFSIHVEDLVKMALGLRLFEGIDGLEQTRDRVFALVEELKSRYLLLSDQKFFSRYTLIYRLENTHIKMHDVVRDVAKYIAAVEKGALVVDNAAAVTARKEQDTHKDLLWISIISEEIRELPTKLRSPQLKLLQCSNAVLQITDSFFDGMEELRVLHVQGMELPQLPSSLRFTSDLRTLFFRECNLNNITAIGVLPKLESLSFEGSHMEEIPIEIGHLTNLVSLDLTRCSGLSTVRPGVISGLCQIQEIYMRDIEIDWEGRENEEGRNASLREFESLFNLHTLHIKIKDPIVLPRSPVFRNLKKYEIQIGARDSVNFSGSYEKCCSISLHTSVAVEGDIRFLSKTAEELLLEGDFTKNVVHELVRDGSQCLKRLELDDIDTLEYLVVPTTSFVLCNVESLSLRSLENLQQITCSSLKVGSLKKLKELYVCKCKKLRNIFQLVTAIELGHLGHLTIQDCKSMEEVIWKERKDDGTNKLALSKLKDLSICNLPSLITFCRGINEIEFPSLESLTLEKLPQLESPFSGLSDESIFPPKLSFPSLKCIHLRNLENMKEIWCGQLQSGSFRNLTELTVEHCHRLHAVFTPVVATYLVHLHMLTIDDCLSMEVVVAKNVEEDGVENTILLPKLEFVFLSKLPALESFCHVVHDLELPMMDGLYVIECPQLKTFSPGSVCAPKLDNVKLSHWMNDKEETLWIDNVNQTILHLHKEASRLQKNQR